MIENEKSSRIGNDNKLNTKRATCRIHRQWIEKTFQQKKVSEGMETIRDDYDTKSKKKQGTIRQL